MLEKTNFFEYFNSTSKEIKVDESYFNLSDEFVLLSLTGFLDTYNSTPFTDIMKKFLELKQRKVLVFDLTSVNYMSSTGIGALVELLKFCSATNVELYLMGLQNSVDEVFQLLGFNSFFSFIKELKDIKEDKITRSKFPMQVACPYCNAALMAKKVGSFKCPQCTNVFRIVESEQNIKIEKRS